MKIEFFLFTAILVIYFVLARSAPLPLEENESESTDLISVGEQEIDSENRRRFVGGP